MTRIQRRILRRWKSIRRYGRNHIDQRQNWNSYKPLQAIRKLSLSYGNAPIICRMHDGGPERASHIPFPLNLETRSDVIPVRIHFCETIPQARQPISHRKIRANNYLVNITRYQVSRGDLISIEENSVCSMGRKVRKYFYIEVFVRTIAGAVFPSASERMWTYTIGRWFRLLTKPFGCRLLLTTWFLQQLRAASIIAESSVTQRS
uniref:Ribosomal protein S4 n=1 Tax=Welwitschia mirabilis TaxID=3377 RepID=A0A8H2SEZ5_WELMI|nr:ribosomal protein S4 [Welwitschia mirabilis]